MDYPWWRKHYAEARDTFSGRLLTVATFGKRTERLMGDYGRNSGVGAMLVAAGWGAKRIIMLGYDCEYAPDAEALARRPPGRAWQLRQHWQVSGAVCRGCAAAGGRKHHQRQQAQHSHAVAAHATGASPW